MITPTETQFRRSGGCHPHTDTNVVTVAQATLIITLLNTASWLRDGMRIVHDRACWPKALHDVAASTDVRSGYNAERTSRCGWRCILADKLMMTG